MSSNPFKSQSRPQTQAPYKRSGENNMQHSNQSRNNNASDMQNRFRGKNAKPIFSLSDADFPEMIAPQSATANMNANATTGLDYKAATSTKDADPEEKISAHEYIPPGHVLIYMDENRNIVQKYGDNVHHGYYMRDEEKEMDPNQILQQLVNSWELRKRQYDELHGEGEYDRVYGMPHRDNDYEYSDADEDYDDINDYYDY
jgi:hypothetical protein